MRFNKYIWGLYKTSNEGKDLITRWNPQRVFPKEDYFQECEQFLIDELQNCGLSQYILKSEVDWFHLYGDYFENAIKHSNTSVKDLYKSWIYKGVNINGFELIASEDFEYWTTEISFISDILYSTCPEYFFHYDFDGEFNKFRNICNEFNIPLTEVPKKKDWDKRALYFTDLCDALLEFRKINGFTPAELSAFLYGFAPNIITESQNEELPKPSKVWFVGANTSNFDFLDESVEDSQETWQGNIDTRRGDILVIYCLSPRSYIHSIWLANDNGFAEPFFYFYSAVRISTPIKLDVHITQKELENNPVWSINPLVRKNLQGINGYPIKYIEYLELLKMLQSKGQNIEHLPRIVPTSKFDTKDLIDERDVEIRLIEPFLVQLKYSPNDWVRQMRVKMGRGERNYPDYCFGANTKRGDESAKMILESKYEIRTNKDLQEAYFQTKSYAMRLQANCFIVAAKEGIWIYKPKNGVYKFDDYINFNWIQIENPDTLHELQLLIGKK